MPEEVKKRAGLMALAMRVRGVPAVRSLPDTNAGGNAQVIFQDGSRITAWKGSHNYEVIRRLRDGDIIDFQFGRQQPGEYTRNDTGATVPYVEFVDVQFILEPETVALSGVEQGPADQYPEFMTEREPTEPVVPRSRAMSADVPKEDTSSTTTASGSEQAEI